MQPVRDVSAPASRACGLSWMLLILSLSMGCGPEGQQTPEHLPVTIERGDECHVCGMIIVDFPGPKGEVYTRTVGRRALKFCSTRDLFAFILEPDTKPHVKEIYVHDMGNTGWDSPADRALVSARSAWYVVGHARRGAMGPTLASFAQKADAENFVQAFGGRVLDFEAIDLEVLASMNTRRMGEPR